MPAPEVVSATPSLDASSRPTVLTVEFDQAIDTTSGFLDPLCYHVDGGLLVLGVIPDPVFLNVSILKTTDQVGGRTYQLSVSGSLHLAAPPYTELNPARSSATFTGLSAPAEYTVSDIRAVTHPHGRKIELFWTNPTSTVPTHCKILRRQRNWPLVIADLCDVVYDGAALDPSNASPDSPKYTDSGLLDETFYYYVVLVRTAPAAFEEPTEPTRAYGLSGRYYDDLDSTGYITKLVPRVWLDQDARSPQDGELAKHLRVHGGAVDVLRSTVESLRFLGDWTETPYPFVRLLSRAMGFEPEGETYDFDTPRRVLLQLRELFSKKGSSAGIIQAVRALTLWESTLKEFGLDTDVRLFGTYGADALDSNSASTGAITFDTSIITDSTKVWADHEWRDGKVRDGLGNWFEVLDTSTSDTLELWELPAVGSRYRLATVGAALIGATSIVVSTTLGLVVGQRIQLHDATGGNSQIVEITGITPGTGTIRFWNPLLYNFPNASVASWRVVTPEASMTGVVAGGSGANTLVADPGGGTLAWPIGKWAGMYVKDAVGNAHLVVSSTANTMTFVDGYVWVAGNSFEVARTFSGGPLVPDSYYQVHIGYMPHLYDPLFDFGLTGTSMDPFHYLYSGKNPRSGAFGLCDVGIYVDLDWAGVQVPTVSSRCSSVSGTVLTDDSASFTVNAFAGLMLIPNQNLDAMFEIVSNTATKIVAVADLTQYATPGQAYVVLTKRQAERFKRLRARVVEFMEEPCPRILFL